LKRLARRAVGKAARGGRSDLGSYLPPAAAQPAAGGLALKARGRPLKKNNLAFIFNAIKPC
jgi:hypothetical protein